MAYTQYELNKTDIIEQINYIRDGMEGGTALIILTIELPSSVDMGIVETAPGIKGSSATSRIKAAILPTSLEVQMLECLVTGEIIKINTTTGK